MSTVRHAAIVLAILWAFGPASRAQEPPAEPAGEEPNPLERVDRIIKNAESAGERLKAQEAGPPTLEIQRKILKDIDALLNQPPQSGGGQGASSGGGGGGQSSGGGSSGGGGSGQSSGGPSSARSQGGASGGQPQGGQSPGGSGRPQGGQAGAGSQGGQGGGQPQPGEGGQAGAKPGGQGGQSDQAPGGTGQPGQPGEGQQPPPPEEPERLAEMNKGVWGHLPERVRQDIDQYYRDRFMPRYADLLRQYYAGIAEAGRGGE